MVQTLMGTFFTWGLTAAGAGMVVIFKGTQRKLLDTSLGFAGGVMTAASYWSLLAPAIEMAHESKLYGQNGEYAFAPVAVGFLVGALFVYGTDFFISFLGVNSPHMVLALSTSNKSYKEKKTDVNSVHYNSNRNQLMDTTTIEGFGESIGNSNVMSRRKITSNSSYHEQYHLMNDVQETVNHHNTNQWKRILLLIVAITVHNIPERIHL
ncbi:hypothetical protein L9F63_019236, partial [Diploptera punctata]